MEISVIKLIETGTKDEVNKILEDFNIRFEQQFAPVGLSKDVYKKLWKSIFNVLSETPAENICLTCLKSLRILSRDKLAFNEVIEDDQLNLVLRLASLLSEQESVELLNHQVNYDVVAEAQKCLSNMVYNSSTVQRMCCYNSCIPGLVSRLRIFRDESLPHKVKSFDLRILFLLSALCGDIRPTLCNEYHCLSYLIDILDDTLKSQMTSSPRSLITRQRCSVVFKEEESSLIIEVLKVLYNLLAHMNRSEPDEEETNKCLQVVRILRTLLMSRGSNPKATDDLYSNSVNLLLLMPPKLYEELIQEMPSQRSTATSVQDSACPDTDSEDNLVEYDGRDMSVIVRLLDFMHQRLKNSGNSANEFITPILSLFVEMIQNVRIIRKIVRMRILPPLRDASKRPEEGESVRSKLCVLMTSPLPNVKYLASNLLFILCKENVDRLIKYTGYGNAAGLLASRGLMLDRRRMSGDYSSDSEASDTEEYDRIKDKVNPVTGCFETPRPSPLEGMTDEQKEYEAMKLVNALDKMTRNSLIQPCCIGEDGKPHPVDDVFQLQEEMIREREQRLQRESGERDNQ